MELPLELQKAIDQDLKELDEIERHSDARRQAGWNLRRHQKVDVVPARAASRNPYVVAGQ